MKLSKSKLALAKVINENGGWVDDSVYAANDECGIICGYLSKPIRRKTTSYHWIGSQRETWIRGIKTPQWHQCVLSREEYYQAYPKADADGWIEWKGGECPVGGDVMVACKVRTGEEFHNTKASNLRWRHTGDMSDIITYRLPPAQAKPEFCESVMRTIPEPEAKPSIEQLAADYRNAKDYADRKQQEADEAKAAADAALGELERAGEALGLLIGIAKPDREPELVITDWRDLKVGDVVEITGSSNNCWKDHSGREMTVKDVYPEQGDNDDQVDLIGESGAWCLGGNTTWRFIRRP